MCLADVESYLRSRFRERDEVIRGALMALVAREHMLIIGPPGTAKSDLVRELERCLGLRRFEWLLTRFSVPEEIVGPVSIKGLENDRFFRVTAGKLPEAQVAFIDEVFKASSAILNTLLAIMNERVFYNDGPVRVPLHALFGASNELPQGDDEASLQAFLARFLLRYRVGYLVEKENFLAMLDLEEPDSWPQLSEADLVAAQQAAARVAVSPEVKEAVWVLRSELAAQGVEISDRQWHRSLKLLRAHAFLEGRDEVVIQEDFPAVYPHVCWSVPEQQRVVARVVLRVSDPLAERALDILEKAEEQWRAYSAVEDPVGRLKAAAEAYGHFDRVLGELRDIAARGGPFARQRAAEVSARIAGWQVELAKKFLGERLPADLVAKLAGAGR